MIQNLVQVALGGAVGASALYLTSVAAMRAFGVGFPWGTIAVNVVGSFLMGALVVFLAHKEATHFAPFLMTGVLGGFTTFSAFSLDVMTLFERGDTGVAAAYALATVVLSLAAVVAGMAMLRGLMT